MNRVKKAVLTLKQNQGVAMIVAMIVGVVIMAFCLSMLLVTYTLFTQTSRQTTQLQCKLLAQSYVETMTKEFEKKPEDSELLTYLGERIKATDNSKWIPMDEADENNPETGITEISFLFDDSSISGDFNYAIRTTFTYESNEVDDDEDGGGIDDDDQDDTPGSGMAGGGGSSTPSGGSYIVHVTTRCVKGGEAAISDKDSQNYTINSDFILNVNE